MVRLMAAALRVTVDLAAALTVGALAFAVVLTSPDSADGLISAEGYRAVRLAARWALLWCATAFAQVSFSAAAGAGVAVAAIATPARWWGLVDAQEEPRTWLAVAVMTGVVAVVARCALLWRSAVGVLVLSLLWLLPPLAAGHSSSGTNHDVATEAIAVHMLFAAVWLGSLARLVIRTGPLGPARAAVLARYGRFASVCWVAVVGSGALDPVVLVGDRAGLTAGYGRLVLTKLVVVGLVGMASLRGRRAVSRRAGRDQWPWWLGVELLGLGSAMGASSVLAQLFPPASTRASGEHPPDVAGLPPRWPAPAATLALAWRPEVLIGGFAVGLGWVYWVATHRLSRSGGRWPRSRTICWVGGCAVLLVATCSGVGRYEPAMFSIHMLSQLLGGVVAPGLISQGAPLSLAMAAANPRTEGLPGVAEWVGAVLGSRPLWLLTHPLVALGLFAGAPDAVYFTSVFDAAAQFHWAHLALAVFFVLVGYLFAWLTVGVDAPPRPLPSLVRLNMRLAAGPCLLVFAALVVTTRRVLGNGAAGYNMYQSLHLPWVPDLLADQRVDGTIALVLGETALLAGVLVLLARWRRLDEDLSWGGVASASLLGDARRPAPKMSGETAGNARLR
jgi:putative copper resistance protein D